MVPKPRWWLFCVGNALDVRYGWRWTRALWAWSLPADWCGTAEGADDSEGVPF